MTKGTYTDHLAEIRVMLAQLDECSAGAKSDRAEIKEQLTVLNGGVRQNAKDIVHLHARQRLIMGIGAVLGTGVFGALLEIILRGLR